MRRKRSPISHLDVLRKLAHAGLSGAPEINRPHPDRHTMPSLEARVRQVLGLISQPSRPVKRMLFFVMYDIESNKVRTLVAKYLIGKGCHRIQRSIFLADLDHTLYDQIKVDLAEVQQAYDNHDSIIVCPISTDQLRAMRIIGKNVNLDIIAHRVNTLFF